MVTSILDTYATTTAPSSNYQGSPKLNLRSTGATAYAFLLPKGFATGADVVTTEAYLDIYTQDAWSACNLTAKRATSKRAFSELTYNNRPSVTSTGAVVTALGALAAGTKVTIDVTDFVDGWATGAFANYGLRLEHDAADSKWMHSADAKTATLRPVLRVVQYRKPTAPQVLGPKGGLAVSLARPKLSWTPPSDPMMAQVEYLVQMNATDVWTSPTYDSGWVSSTDGEHTVTFDIADGETWFWRVKIRNAGGQESSYSSSQEFNRTVKPTFSITQPSGGVWTDSTPPVEWSALSAGTQVQWRVQHFVRGIEVMDTGVRTGTDTDWTFAQPINFLGFDLGPADVTTRVSLRDDVARIATPGDGIWIIEEETWTYTPGATAPFDSITADKDILFPVPRVVGVRTAGTPDRIDVQRNIDGLGWLSIAVAEGADLHTTGDEYEFLDLTAPPRRDIEYRMVAGSNSIDSDDNPTCEVRVEPVGIWILDPDDDTFWVVLLDKDESGLRYTEDSETSYIKGASRPQVTFDAFRGFEGTVTGGVYGDDTSPYLGRTAQQQRDAFLLRTKLEPTSVVRLVLADQNIPIIIRNATQILRPDAELNFGISFDAVQVGELPWSP